MKKTILVFVLIIIVILFIYLLKIDIFRSFDHRSDRSFIVEHFNDCSTELLLSSELNRISSIRSYCKISIDYKNIKKDVQDLIEKYELLDILMNTNRIELMIQTRSVSFPNYIYFLSIDESWPKNIKNEINGNNHFYKEKIYRSLVSYDYSNKFNVFFDKYNCEVTLSSLLDFTEYHISNGYPVFNTHKELIKDGYIEENIIRKDYYPELDWLLLNIDCLKPVSIGNTKP